MEDRKTTTDPELNVPVLEERLQVEIRQHVTKVVRLDKIVEEYEGVVDQDLLAETLSIEHVSVNQYIDEPALVRQEGDVTIFPVMEEVLVVKKQLLLKEEIRVTRQRALNHHHQVIPLRAETISVERVPGPQQH